MKMLTDRPGGHTEGQTKIRRSRPAFRILVALAAIFPAWQLIDYVGRAQIPLVSWSVPLGAAIAVQSLLLGWRMSRAGAPVGWVTLLGIAGPSITLALVSHPSAPRGDVIWFLGSLIGFAIAQVLAPQPSLREHEGLRTRRT